MAITRLKYSPFTASIRSLHAYQKIIKLLLIPENNKFIYTDVTEFSLELTLGQWEQERETAIGSKKMKEEKGDLRTNGSLIT